MSQTYMKRQREAAAKAPAGPAPEQAGPALAGLQGSGFEEAVDAIQNVEPHAGRQLSLDDAMAGRMEQQFGIRMDQVELRESPQVEQMDARAFAKGNVVQFAPGQFQPDTEQGRQLIQHELGHVVQQARGGVRADMPGMNLNTDEGLEHQADLGNLSAGGGAPMSVSSLNAETAPMQGGFFSNIKNYFTKKKQEKYSKKVSDLAAWSGRVSSSEVDEEERQALEKELANMMNTPEGMEQFSKEIVAQRLAASRNLNQVNARNVGIKGEEFGTLDSMYSPEAERLMNLQEMMKTVAFMEGSAGTDLFTQVGGQINQMQQDSPDDYNELDRAGKLIGTDTRKLSRGVSDKRKSYFRVKEDNLKDQLQNRLQAYVPPADMMPAPAPAAPAAAPEKKHWWSRKPKKKEGMFINRSGSKGMTVSEPELMEGPVMTGAGKSYANSRNAAIGEMVRNASPEQLRDPHLQQMVLEMFNQEMSSRLRAENDSSKDKAFSATWRSDKIEEFKTYNTMLKGLITGRADGLEAAAELGGDDSGVEAGISAAQAMVENDPDLQRMIAGAKGAFDGSTHYADEDSQSEMLMNNFVLRVAAPHIQQKIEDERLENDELNTDHTSKLAKFNQGMMQEVSGTRRDKTGQKKPSLPVTQNFRGLAKRLWGRRS